jgi:hypothetical protein
LVRLTDAQHERNMYVIEPGRANIFWQRLEVGYRLLQDIPPGSKVLLIWAAAAGLFSPRCAAFRGRTVVDLDLNDAGQRLIIS